MTCRACGAQRALAAGTLLERTATPLRIWFALAWQLTTGGEVLTPEMVADRWELRDDTARRMLRKLRLAMHGTERPLRGEVQVDQALVGGWWGDNMLWGGVGEHIDRSRVLIAAQLDPTGDPAEPQRVRLRFSPGWRNSFRIRFVRDVVEPGTVVCVPNRNDYRALHPDYTLRQPQSRGRNAPDQPVPAVAQVVDELGGWLSAQAPVDAVELLYLLAEFGFRRSRPPRETPGRAFYRLMQQVVATPPISNDDLDRPKALLGPTATIWSPDPAPGRRSRRSRAAQRRAGGRETANRPRRR